VSSRRARQRRRGHSPQRSQPPIHRPQSLSVDGEGRAAATERLLVTPCA
jgi:hypothetical protein